MSTVFRNVPVKGLENITSQDFGRALEWVRKSRRVLDEWQS